MIDCIEIEFVGQRRCFEYLRGVKDWQLRGDVLLVFLKAEVRAYNMREVLRWTKRVEE